MAQIEHKVPLSILDATGKPVHFGWARSTLFCYDPMAIRVSPRRLTESDRYVIFSSTHLIVFEILESGYLGYVGVSLISFKDKQWFSQVLITPFSMGFFAMPFTSESGSVRIRQKKSSLDFITMQEGVRIIKADIPKFGHHRKLRGELVLFSPSGAQSVVTHMPWRREKNAFCYSRRSPWYIAEGVIQFGTSELIFTRGNAWGIFDWNRGIRPQADIRYWATACGISRGKQIGFSVGYGSADSSMGTENAFFLDGTLHKLDQVTFHISPANWLLPWHFTSNDNRLEMQFIPQQERVEHNRLLFHSLKFRQVCGFFSGKIILDDHSEFTFQNITGFAERRKTRL
ncbi:MAG: DUF2804 domain-containing protein [Treponema sp.]|jgi:hypothetical protein|nr:DUF2804 domain-containing protein [Treponema sp.]